MLCQIFITAALVACAASAAVAEETCAAPPVSVTLYANGGSKKSAQNLTLSRDALKEMGRFFNEEGLPQDIDEVQNGTVLFQAPTKPGLHFVWPTNEVGKRIVTDLKSPSGKPIELEVLSRKPRVRTAGTALLSHGTIAFGMYCTDLPMLSPGLLRPQFYERG